MIKQLRKRHLQVWTALAVLIPIGMVAAVISRPALATGILMQPGSSAALPVLLKTIDKEGYTVSLRGNTDTSALQLEWINKKVLTVPSALVYQIQLGGADTIVVGRIEAVGIYHFNLKKTKQGEVQILLYDIIHHQQADSLHF